MKSNKKIIVFIPNIRRHEYFYKSIYQNFEKNSFDVFFLTLENSNYNYWSKILPNVIKLSTSDLIINSLEIFEKNKSILQIKGCFETVKKVDQKQAPFKKYESIEHYFQNHLTSVIYVFNEFNFDFAFGYSALDVDNVIFNIACVHSNCKPIFMDYSPIDNYEISFKKKYYSEYIFSDRRHIIKSYSDPNKYLLEKRKSIVFLVNRLFSSIRLIFFSENISLFKYIRTMVLRYFVYNFSNRILIYLLKSRNLIYSDINYIFLGSCPNESYFIDGGFDSNYIDEIINFKNENKEIRIYYKPHPASFVESFMIYDFLRLYNSGISLIDGKVNYWDRINAVVAIRSSLLIEAVNNRVPAFSLIEGIHTLFGVKLLESLNDLVNFKNYKINKKLLESSRQYCFPGVQGYYDSKEANIVSLSLLQAITKY